MANLGILFATNLILHQSASPANVCSALSVPSNISRALIWKRTLLVLHFISSTVSTQHGHTLSIFQIYWHLLFYASSSHPRLQPFSLTPTLSYEGSLERELAFVCVDLSGAIWDVGIVPTLPELRELAFEAANQSEAPAARTLHHPAQSCSIPGTTKGVCSILFRAQQLRRQIRQVSVSGKRFGSVGRDVVLPAWGIYSRGWFSVAQWCHMNWPLRGLVALLCLKGDEWIFNIDAKYPLTRCRDCIVAAETG